MIIILGIHQVHPDEIKITPITAGILPFKLGKARLTSARHTFLHYFDLDLLIDQTTALNTQLSTIKTRFDDSKVKNDSTLNFLPISELIDHATYILNDAYEKLENIKPIRSKRALANIVGKMSKWLFGTLDSDDGDHYEQSIRKLETNTKIVQSNTLQQITLNKQIINNFNKSITNLDINQKNIANKVNKLEKLLLRSLLTFEDYLQLQSVLNQIILNGQHLVTILDNIENALMFAKLNTLHSIVISHTDLSNILKTLTTFYDSNQIIKFKDSRTYYQLTSLQATFHNNRIIFAIHFPIVHPQTYNLYELYPIPFKNHTIIPNYPYLALYQNQSFYERNECPNLENIYICSNPRFASRDDCLPNYILNTVQDKCTLTTAFIEETIVEQLAANFAVIIPKNDETQILEDCNEKHYFTIHGPSLITIPPSCSITVENQRIYHREEIQKSEPYILPTLQLSRANNIRKSTTSLRLKKLNLHEIHELSKQINNLQIQPLEQEESTKAKSIFWIMIGIILFLIPPPVIYSIYIIWKKFGQKQKPLDRKISIPVSSNLRREELHNPTI